jgi:hypothetical protein
MYFYSRLFKKEDSSMKSAFFKKHSTISVFILFVTAAVAQMSLVDVVFAQGTPIDALAPRQLAGTAWQFNKYSDNPVLTAGPAGSWDNDNVWSGSVMYHNSKYHMWYTGGCALFNRIRILG